MIPATSKRRFLIALQYRLSDEEIQARLHWWNELFYALAGEKDFRFSCDSWVDGKRHVWFYIEDPRERTLFKRHFGGMEVPSEV
jgi:hypothetical protein